MKYIIKTFGLISLIASVSGANAAVSRVSMVQTPARRLPSVAGWIVQNNGSTSTGTTTTNSSTFSDTECIDAYTGCLKGADVCGSNMEECTTRVLLHAKMPNCLSTLYQCSSSGVNSLFGTSSVTALGNGETKDSYGYIVDYTYPTDGSVLGQMVKGAYLSNMLSTDQCVKKYMNCLKRDSVCGADFELCTTNNEFRKQSINCMSTKARCQSDGLIELFGSTTATDPMAGSRVKAAMDDGAVLAAANAVSTCYKVADQCILNACGANPTRCTVDSSAVLAEISEAIAEGTSVPADRLDSIATTITSRDVSGYIKSACLDVIGGNKYCYATFLGNGQMPTAGQLQDPDNREEVYDEAYSARMNNSMKAKIADLLDKFDKKTKNKCVDTIKSCAMRSCGGGVGSVCYSTVFGNAGSNNSGNSGLVPFRTDVTQGKGHINGAGTYGEIQYGCSAIVNTDASCQYAAAAVANNVYTYQYTDNDVFSTLFPEYGQGSGDPISVVATLEALLTTSYNDAAIAQMKKQCQTVALGCVRSMCGKDFTNCYRNRTDVISGTYKTMGNTTTGAKLDRSMNKMGGILDYNIVIGLCLNTVKNASACEEHLKIAAAEWRDENKKDTQSWGNASSVRESWRDANDTSNSFSYANVVIGCAISTAEAMAKPDICKEGERREPNMYGGCEGIMDEDGCIYAEEVKQNMAEYTLSHAAEGLFSELLADVETEVQAKYNAKLTAEQNMCLANNNGGIMGTTDIGSTFRWAKLKGSKIPSSYASKGLNTKQFTASNDLYGSFCLARITVMSDDKEIQDQLGSDAFAYFAVGDPFTCGSWISRSTLKRISDTVAERAAKEAGKDSKADKWAKKWWEIGGVTLGGLGGFAGMDSIQRNGVTLGGILSAKNNNYVNAEKNRENADTCLKKVSEANSQFDKYQYISSGLTEAQDKNKMDAYNKAVDAANDALRYARAIDSSAVADISFSHSNYGSITSTSSGYQWNGTILTSAKAASKLLANVKNCGDTCKGYLAVLDSYLGLENPNAGTESNATVAWNAAVLACKEVNGGGTSTNNETLDACNLKDTNYADLTFTGLVVPYSTTSTTDAQWNVDAKFSENLGKVKDVCYEHVDEQESSRGRMWKNVAGGVVGAVAGGMLTHGIVENYYDVKYEKAANEAVKEWMSNVGSHIQCYLGTEELGSYGDVVIFDLD